MKSKLLVLTLICIFLISVNVSYACNTNDNIMDISSKEDGKVSNINNSQNSRISLQNTTVNKNISTSKILAAGDNNNPGSLSQNDIIIASQNVNNYISNNGKLPNSVQISNYTYSMPEFMYLLAKTIEYKYEKNNARIIVKYNVKNPSKPSGVDIKGRISQKDYHNYTKRVSEFIISKGAAPNYVSTPLGDMQYQTAIYSFIKLLENKNLPSSLSIDIKKSNEINKFAPKYSRITTKPSKPINEKYDGESLLQYLEETKNCQVNDNIIKSLAMALTSKCTNNYQKAEAIFNYVNNNIVYNLYYNTKYGAKNTISKKVGNCVDKSHLLIALSRASNIPTRYVHGTCNFISGRTYGHVWAQILIGNTWTAADPTHSKLNKLGVIGNWNTNAYIFRGIYQEITF